MELSWEALGAIGELLGALGVIVTLGYLAVQMRYNSRTLDQNTAAIVVGTETANADEASRLYLELARSPGLACVVQRGNKSFAALTPTEMYRFSAYWQSTLLAHQNTYFHHSRGHTGDAAWETYSRHFDAYMALPGVAQWWRKVESMFDPTFRAYINAKIQAAELRPSRQPNHQEERLRLVEGL